MFWEPSMIQNNLFSYCQKRDQHPWYIIVMPPPSTGQQVTQKKTVIRASTIRAEQVRLRSASSFLRSPCSCCFYHAIFFTYHCFQGPPWQTPHCPSNLLSPVPKVGLPTTLFQFSPSCLQIPKASRTVFLCYMFSASPHFSLKGRPSDYFWSICKKIDT